MKTGLTRIYFQENSNLKFIDEAFSSQKAVALYTPSVLSPVCKRNPFANVEKIYLYSPHSFKFCNVQFSNLCTQHKHFSFRPFTLSMIALFS